MADKIKIRRGLFADLPDLDEGELGYVKDRGTVYIGTNTDNNILLNPVLVADDGYTLDGYLYPAVDNVHGLGTPDKRWQSASIGPGSIHIIAKDTDPGYTTNREFVIGIDTISGNLQIVSGDNVLIEANPNTGVSFPSGGGGSSSSGLSEDTFQENKNSQGEINQTIIQSLDGYATVDNTSATGDGYIAFFTGAGTDIAGDNDLRYDRENGILVISGSVNAAGQGTSPAIVATATETERPGLVVKSYGSTSDITSLVDSFGDGATTLIYTDMTTAPANAWTGMFTYSVANGSDVWGAFFQTTAGIGVEGWSNGGTYPAGVVGQLSPSGNTGAGVLGVRGYPFNSVLTLAGAAGVAGSSDLTAGVVGFGAGPGIPGVIGIAREADGYGVGAYGNGSGVGLLAVGDGANATVPVWGAGAGVYAKGSATSNVSIYGIGGSSTGIGVEGDTSDQIGVYGWAGGTGSGGYFESDGSGPALYGDSHFGTNYAIVAWADTTTPVKAALRLVPQDSDPSSASQGDIYVNSISGRLKVYNGSSWVDSVTAGNTASAGDGYIAFFTGTGTGIAGDNDLFYDRLNGRLGINTTTPYGRVHVVSEATSTLPTSFTNDDFVVGKADGTGGIFLRFDTSQSVGVLGAFDNGGSWHTLFIGAHHTVFQNSFGGSGIAFDGTNNVGAIRLRSDGSLFFSQSTDATDTPDTGLSRPSANTLAVGNGTQGDASGTLQAANIQVSGNIINKDLSETFAIIRQSLDGYALDATELQHTQYQDQFNQSVVQSLDGYASLISGIDITETIHTNQQNQVNQTILQSLDGYVPYTGATTNVNLGTHSITATGSGGNDGGTFTGGAASDGVGVRGTGGATNGIGVRGFGTGSGTGVVGNGGSADGAGGGFNGGGSNGDGLVGQGVGTGTGVVGNGGNTGIGVWGTGSNSTAGVKGKGGNVGGTGVWGVGGNNGGLGGDFTGTGNAGVRGTGGSGDSTGVTGTGGTTNGVGVSGSGSGSGTGVTGLGGSSDGIGVQGTGQGFGQGVYGTGGPGEGSVGIYGTGGSAGGHGLQGVGTGSTSNYFGVYANSGRITGDLSIDGGIVNNALKAALDGYLSSSTGVTANTTATGDGYIAFFTGTGTAIAGDNDLFYDRLNSRLGLNTPPFGGFHMLSQAMDTTPTAFTTDDFVVGGFGPDGATNTGSFFFRYNKATEIGFMGVLSPGVAWRALTIGAANTNFQNPSGVPGFSIDGNAGNFIRLRSDGALVFSSTADATGTADTGLSRTSAGVVAVGNGTQGDASGTLLAANITVAGNINNFTLSETIQVIRQALDGYALDANEITHTQYQDQFNQSVVQALDGYALNATELQHTQYQDQFNQSVVQALDGYALDANEIAHTQYQDQFNQSVVQSLDGYQTQLNTTVSETTFQNNKTYQQQFNQSVQQALDGYALDATELQHTQYQDQFNQSVVQALDGYALNATELQHTQYQDQFNQSVVQALDGYQTQLNTTVSETTFQNNKTYQQQFNQSVQQALDGYSGSVGAVTSLDSAARGDGYVAFFTGTGSNIQGDNDLFYDRTNGRLGINTTVPDTALTVRIQHQQSIDGMFTFSTEDSKSMYFLPSLGGGSFNGLVSAGDSAIIFSGATQDTGNLVIGPWSSVSGGLRIQGSNGYVGIGTASPAYPLMMKNTGLTTLASFGNDFGDLGVSNVLVQVETNQSAGNYAGLSLQRGGNTGGYVTVMQNGINIGQTADGATPQLFVGMAGGQNLHVGIGTITPTNALEVVTTSGNAIVATGGTSDGYGVFGIGGTSNGIGILGSGNGTGVGVKGVGGGASAAGVYGIGGESNGAGVLGLGGFNNGYGVSGTGSGTGYGIYGQGGATAPGVYGAGGSSGSIGVQGQGSGTSPGGFFSGGGSGGVGVAGVGQGGEKGVSGAGGSSSGTGVYGEGGAPNGSGVSGQGTGTGTGVGGTGGATAGTIGVFGAGGSGGGYGGYFQGTGIYRGVEAIGGTGGGNCHGINATGGSTGGVGVVGTGTSGSGGVTGFGSSLGGAGVSGVSTSTSSPSFLAQDGYNFPDGYSLQGDGNVGLNGYIKTDILTNYFTLTEYAGCNSPTSISTTATLSLFYNSHEIFIVTKSFTVVTAGGIRFTWTGQPQLSGITARVYLLNHTTFDSGSGTNISLYYQFDLGTTTTAHTDPDTDAGFSSSAEAPNGSEAVYKITTDLEGVFLTGDINGRNVFHSRIITDVSHNSNGNTAMIAVGENGSSTLEAGHGLYGIGGTSSQGGGTGVIGVAGSTSGVGGKFFGDTSGAGIIATGGSSGNGGTFTGGGGNAGVSATGGTSNGTGVSGTGGATNGKGIVGQGTGTGTGVQGTGGSTDGYGGNFTGGATNGAGVIGTGTGTGAGGYFVGGSTGYGIIAQGTQASPTRSAFRIIPQASAPTVGNIGDLYVNNGDGKLYICTVAGYPGSLIPVTWTVVGSQA